VHQVLNALANEVVPSRLEALAAGLPGRFPLTIHALRAKADVLRSQGEGGGGARAPHPLPAAQVPGAPPEGAPEGLPTPPLAPAHPQMPLLPPHPSPDRELHAAAILQAAMRALVEEPDPVVLDGFATSIQEPYPMAASLLEQRAHALRAAAHAPLPVAPAAATPSPSPAAGGPNGAPGGAQPGVMEGRS
jgi:hypothetical protein